MTSWNLQVTQNLFDAKEGIHMENDESMQIRNVFEGVTSVIREIMQMTDRSFAVAYGVSAVCIKLEGIIKDNPFINEDPALAGALNKLRNYLNTSSGIHRRRGAVIQALDEFKKALLIAKNNMENNPDTKSDDSPDGRIVVIVLRV